MAQVGKGMTPNMPTPSTAFSESAKGVAPTAGMSSMASTPGPPPPKPAIQPINTTPGVPKMPKISVPRADDFVRKALPWAVGAGALGLGFNRYGEDFLDALPGLGAGAGLYAGIKTAPRGAGRLQHILSNAGTGATMGWLPGTARDAYKTLTKESAKEKVGLFLTLPGRMARLFPNKESVDGSPPHVTFLYIGEVPSTRIQELKDICARELFDMESESVHLGELDCFPAGDSGVPWFVKADVPKSMKRVRMKLVDKLREAGFTLTGKGVDDWKPHATLQYLPEGETYSGSVPSGSFRPAFVELWNESEVLSAYPLKYNDSISKMSKAAVLAPAKSLFRGMNSALWAPLKASPLTTGVLGTGALAYGTHKAVGESVDEMAKDMMKRRPANHAQLYRTYHQGSGSINPYEASINQPGYWRSGQFGGYRPNQGYAKL